MRRLILSTAIILAASLGAASSVQANGFETTLAGPVSGAVKVEVMLSDSLVHRANHLPKEISKRNGRAGLNSGFSSNGYYGEKSLNGLQDDMRRYLVKDLSKRGVSVDDNASTVLRVTLVDVKNNRPTFEQLSRESGLSFQSYGTGGADITAEVITSGGQSLGTMSYDYYDLDIREAQFQGTWSDTKQAMRRFSKRAAKTLTN